MFNIPNTLTSIRIILIPFFCGFFLTGNYAPAGAVLILSGVSDCLDGQFARRLHQETELGKILDPIADKLTLGAVVGCMWYVYHKHFAYITIPLAIMLLKEVLMAIGGVVIVNRGKKLVKAKWWGKVSTVVFYLCMILIVVLNYMFDEEKLKVVVPALAFFSAGFMVVSLVMYFVMALKIIHGEEVSGTIDFEKEIMIKEGKESLKSKKKKEV